MSTHGGRANELGSLHRSGFAALLAAYGLRGLPLPFLPDDGTGPLVASLQFETEDAVDDIRCNLTDGSYIVFQAKRSCGVDKNLTATVDQWVAQLCTLGPSDKVGLVVRNAKGSVKHLKEALDNFRSALPRKPTIEMGRAISAVRSRIPTTVTQEDGDRLIRSAFCVEASTEAPGDSHFDNAVALLDSVIVAHGFGGAAVRILQGNFQRGSASGIGSNVDDWLDWLEADGLTTLSNPLGPPGPRHSAERDCLREYRQSWKDQADKLHYSLLADDLPILEMEGLARTYKVVIPGRKGKEEKKFLLSACRRWRRLLLIGLPGSGKSTAARQIAADWARHNDAPIPIFVPLKRVAESISDPTDVTLDLLISTGIAGSEVSVQPLLQEILMRHAKQGDVLLLLDGLDECRSLSGVISNGIESLLRKLHASTSVIVTSRDSSAPAARKLKLPEVRLCEPDHLERNMDSLLAAIAEVRVYPAERAEWLLEKRANIDESRVKNSDIWAVPLLATMLTLLTASRDDAILPSGRAAILHSVVEDSVRKWELKRLDIQPPGGWNTALRTQHLIDGFGVIGHTINSVEPVTSRQVETALKQMLSERWRCSVGEVEALSPDIRWFWDEHVGVFVEADRGRRIEARSRQFTEIAEAMWVAQQCADDKILWIARALCDEEMREAMILASGLSSEIAEMLMDESMAQEELEIRGRGFLWLLQSLIDEPSLATDRLSQLTTSICEIYSAGYSPLRQGVVKAGSGKLGSVSEIRSNVTGRQLEVDGFGWVQLVSLARVGIPGPERNFRDRCFGGLELDSHRRNILGALTALTDAKFDQMPLNDLQVAAVKRLLGQPLEMPADDIFQISRRSISLGSDRERLLSGHLEVGILALPHLQSLGEDVLPHLKILSGRSPISQYNRFSKPLMAAGIDMSPSWVKALANLSERFGEDDLWSGILLPLSRIAPEGQLIDSHASKDRRWRMPDLTALLDAIEVSEVGIGDYRTAVTEDSGRLLEWLTVIAETYHLDLAECASQAFRVLGETEDVRRYEYDFLFSPMGDVRTRPSAVHIDLLRKLISYLEAASSDWLASVCYVVLVVLGDARAVRGLRAVMRAEKPNRRTWATIAWCASSPNSQDAAAAAFSYEDPAVREGAVLFARMAGGEDGPLCGVLRCAAEDSDGSIRWSATKDEDLSLRASFWSCSDCSHRNDMELLDCCQCLTGTRLFG
ncbi:NACHT domain-containing protein [Streptomyces sp. NPDC059985]|uniref:NACHT domain-containing protein n=1 Tax=Streptomyces sp. NPDC059985 TaxID=3347025 RepID=UPI0036B841CC